jgi:class 3 adenylate cyclase
VTLPDFALRGGDVRTLADSVSVALYPRVPTNQREDWEDYAGKHLERIDDALQFEQGHIARRSLSSSGAVQTRTLLESQQNTSEEVSKFVFSFEDGQKVATQDDGPFFPLWQSSPVWTKLINFDLASSKLFTADIQAMLSHHNAIIGKAIDLAQEDSTSGTFQAFADYWAASESFLQADEPVSKVLFPVFDRLSTSTKRDREPVGVLVTVFFWESFFYGVLPPGSSGITAVVMNECDQVYTYLIEGGDVHFVGKGDHHDSRYNSLYEAAPLFEVVGVENSDFGFHLEDLCHYRMRIYPTEELEQEYITAKPWVFLGIVLVLFTFVIVVTLIYDHKVDKRQKVVMAKAQQAGDIVSSIFPAAVRNKLYQGNEDSSNSKGDGPFKTVVPSVVSSQKGRIKNVLDERPTPGPHEEETQLKVSSLEKAIADIFPDVTIMFADIVGFTSWSSQREPGEVFMLLQTVFHAFDANAKAMSVFKAETIGDCYVAATGLPAPQTDHAPRMARFASKCMMDIMELTRELEVTLGPDTGDLKMRTSIGMHSGPVIAGVLKGAKTRFQLFGDTMNMAARMEHNSAKNRIQCSEATAVLLISAGKELRVRPREDLVQAKGKGEVQTYWIVPRAGGTATSVASSDQAGGFADEQPSAQNQNGKESWNVLSSVPNNRYQRLIDWNIELLAGLLK